MKSPPLKISATGQLQATTVFKIRKIVLVAPVAVATVVITDTAGAEWVRLKAVADDCTVADFGDSPLEMTGLIVTTLTSSAVVLLYLADS